MSAKLRARRVHDGASIVNVAALCLGLCVFHVRFDGAVAQGTMLTAADTALPEDLEEDEPEVESTQPALSLCQTDLRLSGTFLNAGAPQRSFASFHVRADHPGGEVYRIGERVGAYGILSIEPRTVVLDDGAAGCYLKLAGAAVVPPAAPAKRHKKKRKKGSDKAEEKPEEKKPEEKDFTAEELNAAIRPLGGDRYEIKKDLLPKIAQRSAQLRSSTQWTQVRGYSSVLGLRLEKIANEGLLQRLGLRTGDTIKTLNGLQLSSLEGALEAQKLISSSAHLSLLIQRDGTPVTLDYRVVP